MPTPDLPADPAPDRTDAVRRAARSAAERFAPEGRLALPEALRRHLLVGSCGKVHLLEAAALGIRALSAERGARGPEAETDLARTCVGALLAAWAESPFSGDVAAQVLGAAGQTGLVPEAGLRLLRDIAGGYRRPDNLEYYARLAARRDFERIRRYLEGQAAKEPDNLFWLEQTLVLGGFEGDMDWALGRLDAWDKARAERFAPAVNAVRAQAALQAGTPGPARHLAPELAPVFGAGFAAALRAQASRLEHDRPNAAAALAEALTADPWRAGAALALHDLVQGRDVAAAPLPGPAAVLLYSFNKADALDRTLTRVFASDLDGARVLALNNGSADHTADVLHAWADRAGERLVRIDLPVNIGAPAARNWLAHRPEARDCAFCAYLDDDALVPADWLGRLGAAVAAYPEAGVWGCKVVDDAQPARIQAADLHLLPRSDAEAGRPDLDLTRLEPNPIHLSDLHIQTLDMGQFDYLRPCDSVTGCCHLFRTDDLLASGGFSLFLSPSQYDDMEHDLRLAESGRFAVYQGHLRVRHEKRTGRESLTPGPASASALGNRYKMQAMHERAAMDAARERAAKRLTRDLTDKLEALAEAE